MAESASAELNFVVVPGDSLRSQPWWDELHSVINTSFQLKELQAFPLTWERLNEDSTIAATGLGEELGSNGYLVVVLLDAHPIACGGILPFRGLNWIDHFDPEADTTEATAEAKPGELTTTVSTVEDTENAQTAAKSTLVDEWEVCCFCVHPSQRHRKLSRKLIDAMTDFLRPKGIKRFYTNYVIEETGEYWQKMGFVNVPGSGGSLPKGWTHTPGTPGLLDDIHFRVGVKAIE